MASIGYEEVWRQLYTELLAVIERYAKGDESRQTQIGRKLRNRASVLTGDITSQKESLKRRIVGERGLRCEMCGASVGDKRELDLDRIDTTFNDLPSRDFGYFSSNVRLVCKPCHLTRHSGH